MNLEAIVSPIIAAVNPPVAGTWTASTGYAIAPTGKSAPAYAEPVEITMQVQALSGPELALVEGLNVQGVKRAVYIQGAVEGVRRVDAKGGDLLGFLGKVWLVATVLETWDVAGWCKVAVSEQLG